MNLNRLRPIGFNPGGTRSTRADIVGATAGRLCGNLTVMTAMSALAAGHLPWSRAGNIPNNAALGAGDHLAAYTDVRRAIDDSLTALATAKSGDGPRRRRAMSHARSRCHQRGEHQDVLTPLQSKTAPNSWPAPSARSSSYDGGGIIAATGRQYAMCTFYHASAQSGQRQHRLQHPLVQASALTEGRRHKIVIVSVISATANQHHRQQCLSPPSRAHSNFVHKQIDDISK